MWSSPSMLLLGVALIWLVLCLPEALAPRKTIRCRRRVYRRLRIISAARFERPITRRRIIYTFAEGWIFVCIACIMLCAIPVQFARVSPTPPVVEPAPETRNLQAISDATVRPYVDHGPIVGIAIGIIRNGERAVFGYGRMRLENARPPDGDTLFEIGSITKVFTAILAADMVRQGQLSLDDPVQKHLPDTVRVPMYEDKPIRLVDLLTQTSGLPRLPKNLFGWRNLWGLPTYRNPYARCSVDQLYAFLSAYTLPRTPGSAYEYSNLGVGLVGHILELRTHQPYEPLVVERICDPVGMPDTRITLSPDQNARLAQGYEKRVEAFGMQVAFPAHNWDIPTFAGAGALRSTVNDLLEFMAANMGLTPSPLEAAMEMTHEPRHDVNPKIRIGLCWHLLHLDDVNEPIIWHNGGTGGYSAFLGFAKTHRTGVVVLSNTAGGVDGVAITLLKKLLT